MCYTKKKEQHIENLMRGVKSSLAIPGHVQASFNWNELLESNGDMESTKITDGTKVIVCYLKTNERNYTSVAYPVDQSHPARLARLAHLAHLLDLVILLAREGQILQSE